MSTSWRGGWVVLRVNGEGDERRGSTSVMWGLNPRRRIGGREGRSFPARAEIRFGGSAPHMDVRGMGADAAYGALFFGLRGASPDVRWQPHRRGRPVRRDGMLQRPRCGSSKTLGMRGLEGVGAGAVVPRIRPSPRRLFTAFGRIAEDGRCVSSAGWVLRLSQGAEREDTGLRSP